jgi:hypothetical protein
VVPSQLELGLNVVQDLRDYKSAEINDDNATTSSLSDLTN